MSAYSEDVVLGVAIVTGSLERLAGLTPEHFTSAGRRAIFVAIRDAIACGTDDLLVRVYHLLDERGQRRLLQDLKAKTGAAFELAMIVELLTRKDLRTCGDHVAWILRDAEARAR